MKRKYKLHAIALNNGDIIQIENGETSMNKELKTVVNQLKDNNNIQTGEDGGSLLMTLAEYLAPVTYQPLGLFRHPSYDPVTKDYSLKGTLCSLYLIIYKWNEYKFVVTESVEENPSPGGTCYSGTVELYYE